MKIHFRFFIIFFFFALFFSLASYLAQDYLFKSNKSAEEKRIDNELILIKEKIEENDDESLMKYIRVNNIYLTEVYFDNKIIINEFIHEPNELTKYLAFEYPTKRNLETTCKYIDTLDDKILKEKTVNAEGNFIVQKFCVNERLYILASPYIQYDYALDIIRESYLPIFLTTIVVASILAYIIATYISKPIKNISYVIRKLSNLDFSTSIEITGNDEIGQLATDINILANKFEYSLEKLKETVLSEKESKDRQIQLFASMSHELKTPITIVKGTLEGIKDQIGPYKNPLDHVDDLIKEVNNLESIVMHLLSYAKFSVNDVKLNFKPHYLEDLIDDSLERLEYLIDEKNINIDTKIINELVDVDYASISMVFKNVIENAIFYSEPNANLEIFTSEFSDYMLIQVYNHGTNINPESLAHIFEPFYRDENSRMKYKNGTGLGLTIVKQVLEQHRSNYSLYNINNDEDYAVCFEFTLKKPKKKD